MSILGSNSFGFFSGSSSGGGGGGTTVTSETVTISVSGNTYSFPAAIGGDILGCVVLNGSNIQSPNFSYDNVSGVFDFTPIGGVFSGQILTIIYSLPA